MAKLAVDWAMIVPKMSGGDEPAIEKPEFARKKTFCSCAPPARVMERMLESVIVDEEMM